MWVFEGKQFSAEGALMVLDGLVDLQENRVRLRTRETGEVRPDWGSEVTCCRYWFIVM